MMPLPPSSLLKSITNLMIFRRIRSLARFDKNRKKFNSYLNKKAYLFLDAGKRVAGQEAT